MTSFADIDRDAPGMPPHTCPDIDRAIGALRSVGREIAYAARHCEHDDTTDSLEAIERIVDDIDLEPLRKQNEELRTAADWWRSQAQSLCEELDAQRGAAKGGE